MQTRLKITFQAADGTPGIRRAIARHVAKLEEGLGALPSCRVIVKGPGAHGRGDRYEVNLHLTLAQGPELNIGLPPKEDERYADVTFAVDDTFRRARRRLLDLLRHKGNRPKTAERPPSRRATKVAAMETREPASFRALELPPNEPEPAGSESQEAASDASTIMDPGHAKPPSRPAAAEAESVDLGFAACAPPESEHAASAIESAQAAPASVNAIAAGFESAESERTPAGFQALAEPALTEAETSKPPSAELEIAELDAASAPSRGQKNAAPGMKPTPATIPIVDAKAAETADMLPEFAEPKSARPSGTETENVELKSDTRASSEAETAASAMEATHDEFPTADAKVARTERAQSGAPLCSEAFASAIMEPALAETESAEPTVAELEVSDLKAASSATLALPAATSENASAEPMRTTYTAARAAPMVPWKTRERSDGSYRCLGLSQLLIVPAVENFKRAATAMNLALANWMKSYLTYTAKIFSLMVTVNSSAMDKGEKSSDEPVHKKSLGVSPGQSSRSSFTS